MGCFDFLDHVFFRNQTEQLFWCIGLVDHQDIKVPRFGFDLTPVRASHVATWRLMMWRCRFDRRHRFGPSILPTPKRTDRMVDWGVWMKQKQPRLEVLWMTFLQWIARAFRTRPARSWFVSRSRFMKRR